jgi:para-nitrobenzyl esterase
MSNTRRDFIKSFGGSAAVIGLGGITVSSCSTVTSHTSEPDKKETLPEQIVEVSDKGAIIETPYGKVKGYRRNGIYTYKGIPYGASTAGANRFMAPKEPKPWTGVRNALTWGPSSPQNSGRKGNANLYKEIDTEVHCNAFTCHWSDLIYSEDCLRINVWTPGIKDNRKRPVLVWLHGGGFTNGSSINLDAYIGENLSNSGDVVVCTINHRLNAFGYINLATVGGERYKNSPNAGMLDIVAALRWVNTNIGNFGGDPGNVTLFGQSGGGHKTSLIMAMPAAKGLFHKAMTMSGSALRAGDYDKAAELGGAVLKEAGLTSSEIGKLQELPWMDFFDLTVKAEGRMRRGFSPCVDTLNIPHHPFDPVAPRLSAGIPMIIGCCMNEESPSADDPSVEDITFDGLKMKLTARFKDKTNGIVDAYARCFPEKKPIEIWGLLAAEARNCALLQAERQTANGGSVYNYWFNWKTPLYDGRPRATHSSDICFWFNNTDVMDTLTGGGARPRRLAEKMSRALINFARTGNPNHSGIPNWPKYDAKNGAVMIWDDSCEVKNDPDREARKLLNA